MLQWQLSSGCHTVPMERVAGSDSAQAGGRWLLAALLFGAGIAHFAAQDAFLAQVPAWLAFPEAIVLVSGVVELVLAVSLLVLRSRRTQVGWIVAGFFVIVFPGNVWQFLAQNDAFGLDSDFARGVRLLIQPLLVAWALWCTGAWSAWRSRRTPHS